METSSIFNYLFWEEQNNAFVESPVQVEVLQGLTNINNRINEINDYWSTINNTKMESQRGDFCRELKVLTILQEKCVQNLSTIVQTNEQVSITHVMVNEMIRDVSGIGDGEQGETSATAINVNQPATLQDEVAVKPVVVMKPIPYEHLNALFVKLWFIRPMAIINKGHVRDFMKELVDSTSAAKRKFPNALLPEEAIVSSVHSRLDIPSRVMFSRDLQLGKQPTIASMIEFLTYRIDNIQSYEFFTAPMAKKQKVTDSSPKAGPSGVVTTTTIKKTIDGKYKKICAHCDNSHHVAQCAQFKTAIFNARRKTVTRAKLCWHCLMPGHVTNACTGVLPCPKCAGNHHILMCREADDSE